MTIRRVDVNSTDPSPDGSTWAKAYQKLEDAIAASANSDTIWVAQGTYKPSSTGDQTLSFAMKSGMFLYGGFNGTETYVSQRDWETNVTILSGDLNGDDTDDFAHHSDNSYHVITCVANGYLDGFTITGGNATVGAELSGGAIKSGVTIVQNCIFELNQATNYGGAIYTISYCSITNTSFINNRTTGASASGGAIFHSSVSALSLYTCTLTNNNAAYGGAVKSSRSVINNCTFTENIAIQAGGAITLDGVYTSYISKTLFQENDAQGAGWGGGAVAYYNGASIYFTECAFYANTASVVANAAGGAIYPRASALGCWCYNCIFVGNSALGGGGAIGGYINTSVTLDMKIIGCTFYNNTAYTGGAISSASAGASSILNCLSQNNIFWQNTATAGGNDGDTIYVNSPTGATTNVTVKYCDVQNGNTATNISLIGAGTSNLTYDTSNINNSPNWVNANKYDEWFTENAGFKLTNSSPCIDNGDISGLSYYATRDILYHNRPISARSDIGAYEYYCSCGGRAMRRWFNSNESAVPYESISGAGLIAPLNNDHTALWEDYTYGFTVCTDTNTGDEYVYRTVKTATNVYYQIYSTEFGDAFILQDGYNFKLRDGGRLLLR